MVIVDGENGDVEPRSAERQDDAFLAQLTPLFARCRAAIIAGRPLPPETLPGSHHAFPCNKVFFRKMPDPAFSPALNAYISRLSKTQIPLWNQIISEEQQMPEDEQYLRTHIHRMGDKPLYILTAMDHYGDLSHLSAKQRAQAAQFEQMNAHAQAQWLALSSDAKQWFAPKSGHYIELEDPSLVVRAVDDAVKHARR